MPESGSATIMVLWTVSIVNLVTVHLITRCVSAHHYAGSCGAALAVVVPLPFARSCNTYVVPAWFLFVTARCD